MAVAGSCWLAIAAGCVACDQGTKRIAGAALRDRPSVDFLDHTVRFGLAHNTGGWGSLGADWPQPLKLAGLVLLPVIALGVIALRVLRARNPSRLEVAGIALLVGGGFGNLIDRVVSGSVLDFVVVGRGWLSTNVFNVADLAIVVGMALWALATLRERLPRPA